MAKPRPDLVYAFLAAERDEYLDYAEESAKIFDPTIAPRGDRIEERPWTSEGISNLRSLTSSIMKIIMPPGVMWGGINMPPEIWNELERLEVAEEITEGLVNRLKMRMRARSNNMIESLGQKNTRARFSSLVHRNLIEGNNGWRNTPEGLTIYPLRSIGVKRNENGELVLLAIHEQTDPDPMAIQDADDFDKSLESWTIIDYERNEIWRKTGADDEAELVTDEEPVWYGVLVPQIPDVGNYAVGYCWQYLRLLTQINHEESSLAQAMAFASWKPIGLREGSSLADDPKAVMNKKTGEPLIMQDGDIIWPDTGNAIRDWGWVATMRNDDRSEAGNAFAKGLKDRPASGEMAATVALEIVDEINSTTADLLGSYEETGQKPLLRSESRLHDMISPLFTGTDRQLLGPLVRVMVTTGINALDKQRSMARMALQFLPMVMKMDPTIKANGMEILDRIGESILVKTEGMYSQKSPQELQLEMAMAMQAQGGGSQKKSAREETVMTAGGPQPPQGAPPSPN